MEVQCSEGVANHTGPESCGVRREAHVEALTGEPPGWVLSHEMTFRMPTLFRARKARRGTAPARAVPRSGVVGDPSMAGRSLHGNREVSRLTAGFMVSLSSHADGPHREASRRRR